VATAKGFRLDTADAPFVCLSYFGAASKPAHVRYLVRRVKRAMPGATILAGFWMLGEEDSEKAEAWRVAVGAQFAATSLTEAVNICLREAEQTSAEHTPKRRPATAETQSTFETK
jgi:hypothetical protein